MEMLLTEHRGEGLGEDVKANPIRYLPSSLGIAAGNDNQELLPAKAPDRIIWPQFDSQDFSQPSEHSVSCLMPV